MPESTNRAWLVSRRAFLRYAAITAGLASLTRLRAMAAAPATVPALRVLSARQAEVLMAVAERMVDSGDPSMPAVRETRALEIIDWTLAHVEESVQAQLRWLLWLFEYGPPIFAGRFSTFTSLSPEEKDDYIRGWAQSRFATRRLAFRALKNISMLGYYADDSTWPGIRYDGPWLPRPSPLRPGRGAAGVR